MPGGLPALMHAREAGGHPPSAHKPVMCAEVARFLVHSETKVVFDGTVGCGGHAEYLLSTFPRLKVIGVDRDPHSLELARHRLARFGNRVLLRRASYAEIEGMIPASGSVDGIFLDLGLSSVQLDEPRRGFSHRYEGPLDMRFAEEGKTAAELLQEVSAGELASWLRRYGEVEKAGRLAELIVARAAGGKMATTGQLRDAVVAVYGSRAGAKTLSKVCQAIRIVVNDELGHLKRFLPLALHVLNGGGRLVVISYHSLEDRIVKRFMKKESTGCLCPPRSPLCTCGHTARLKVLTRRVIIPSAKEQHANPRARSARLRAAEVIAGGGA